ncbi:MAG: hypothetical protein PHQ86_03370 [Dehalococcoidales bacterium]|nr:hypothetical protein [Dehalococcoidales bacterium]
MSSLKKNLETGCCPRFNPEPWEEKEMTWQDRLFIKSHIRNIMHIPLGFGKMMTSNMEMVERADALLPEPLVLSDEKSLWGSDVYIGVSKEVPQADNVKISGTFLTKVFEGPYKDMGKWAKEMKAYVIGKGKEMKKMYFFYTTCPKCAKYYGKNYTVILAEV